MLKGVTNGGSEKICTICLINRLLPSSKNPHFQNAAKCTTCLVKMSFICMRMKNYFISKAELLTSFSCRGPGELGNGLLSYQFWCKYEVPAVSREPSPQTKYSPSPPMTDSPSPRALLLTIQFSLGGTILTLHRSLTKNANQCVKSSLSTPLLFDTELAASHYLRASQLAPSICSGQPSLTWAVPAFKQKPSGFCLSSSDRH